MKYSIDHDYHVHTKLSLCSNDPNMTTDNIKEITNKHGYKQVVITNHVWDALIEGAPEWYQRQNYDYIKQEKPDIDLSGKLLFGGEVEFPFNKKLAMDKSRFSELDFIVVPINHLHMKGVTFFGDTNSIVDYANALTDRLDAFSQMDLPWQKVGLAHLTWTFLSPFSIDEILANCDMQVFENAFERIAKNGGGIELNAECFSIKKPSNAEFDLYKLAKKKGCKFYLASDAHTLNQFENAPKKFEYIIDSLGLKEEDKFVLKKG